MDDTVVVCAKCRRSATVSFAVCLREGWPLCCGQTMSLTKTTVDVGEATGQAVRVDLDESAWEALQQ